jgi:hypothetical protein
MMYDLRSTLMAVIRNENRSPTNSPRRLSCNVRAASSFSHELPTPRCRISAATRDRRPRHCRVRLCAASLPAVVAVQVACEVAAQFIKIINHFPRTSPCPSPENRHGHLGSSTPAAARRRSTPGCRSPLSGAELPGAARRPLPSHKCTTPPPSHTKAQVSTSPVSPRSVFFLSYVPAFMVKESDLEWDMWFGRFVHRSLISVRIFLGD